LAQDEPNINSPFHSPIIPGNVFLFQKGSCNKEVEHVEHDVAELGIPDFRNERAGQSYRSLVISRGVGGSMLTHFVSDKRQKHT
jgi:hypothetical protein